MPSVSSQHEGSAAQRGEPRALEDGGKTPPRPELDHGFWEVWGAASFALGQWFDRSSDINATVIEPYSQWFAGRRVVDLGCGAGEVTQRMAAAGARVTGVEWCPALAYMARARLGFTRVWLGDWSGYAPDGAVDVVTLWNSTFGIESSDDALRRALGWLPRGGRVLVDVVDAERLAARFAPSSEMHLGGLTLVERRVFDESCSRIIVSWELESGAALGGYEFRLFDSESLLIELSRAGFSDASLLRPYDPDRLVATATS